MYKQLLIMLLISLPGFAQKKLTEHYVDSMSYTYYLNSDWKNLIQIGDSAKECNITFKYLEQRLGFAHFCLGDYYLSQQHYRNALKFDENDILTLKYLMYNAQNIGNEWMEKFYVGKINRLSYNIKKTNHLKPIEKIDLEYNYKINNYTERSNSNYYRIGLNSEISYKSSIYMSFSKFDQINNQSNKILQNDYFVLFNYSPFSRTLVSLGFHYIDIDINESQYNFNNRIYSGSIEQHLGRFDLSVCAIFTKGDTVQNQISSSLGYHFKSFGSPVLKSTFNLTNRNNVSTFVFQQYAGMFVFNNCWISTEAFLGRLNNFITEKGLYVYNSIDPTVFRVSNSIFLFINRRLTLFSNYTFDKKLIIDNKMNYSQHSIAGGLIWKL